MDEIALMHSITHPWPQLTYRPVTRRQQVRPQTLDPRRQRGSKQHHDRHSGHGGTAAPARCALVGDGTAPGGDGRDLGGDGAAPSGCSRWGQWSEQRPRLEGLHGWLPWIHDGWPEGWATCLEFRFVSVVVAELGVCQVCTGIPHNFGQCRYIYVFLKENIWMCCCYMTDYLKLSPVT
jgi:hypothetical protein